MNRVEQLEIEIQKLSPAELRQVRDWLREFADARLGFNNGANPAIHASEVESQSPKAGLQRLLSRPALGLTPRQFNASMEADVWDQ